MADWLQDVIMPPGTPPPKLPESDPVGDILAREANIPTPPPVAQGIPSNLISIVPEVMQPPPLPGLPPLAARDPVAGEVLQPPPVAGSPAMVPDPYAIPMPPPAPGAVEAPPELAPDFAAVDFERAKDALEAGPSVDAAGAAKTAQAAEQTYETMTLALTDAQTEVTEVARKQVALEGRAKALDETIATLKGNKKRTPEETEALKAATEERGTVAEELAQVEEDGAAVMQRFKAAREQAAIAKDGMDTARGKAETDLAIAERQAEIMGKRAQEAGSLLFAKKSREIDRAYRAKAAAIDTAESEARARMDDDRKAYREALKTGPAKQGMVLTVAAVLGEALAARSTGREPDFNRVIGQLVDGTKAEFNERVQRQLALVAEGEDSLAKSAQERRVLDAQRAAQRAEILATIEMDIQEKMIGARGTVREAELAMAAGDVRKAKEAALQVAMDAQAKNRAAELKAQGDLALQEAQIRKTNAEASKTEAEAAKKAGMGSGKPKVESMSVREPGSVYIPIIGVKLAQFPEGEEKQAKEAGVLVNDGFSYLQKLNEYEQALEDYGRRELMDNTEWSKSAEYATLETRWSNLKTALAKVIAGRGLSTTQSDVLAAEKMVPLPEQGWKLNDTSLAAVREMRRLGEDELRTTLTNHLDDAAQEKLIREVRRFGISKRDLRKALLEKAPEIIRDTSKPVDTRLEAVGVLSDNIRKGIKSEGDQAERDAILAEINEIKNATTRILDTEFDPEDPVGGVTDDANEVVRALRERQRELEKQWKEIGKAGIGVSEREQRDAKAGPGPKPSKIGGML